MRRSSVIQKELDCPPHRKRNARDIERIVDDWDNNKTYFMKKFNINNDSALLQFLLLNKYFDLPKILKEYGRHDKPLKALADADTLPYFWNKKHHKEFKDEIIRLTQSSLEGSSATIKLKDVQQLLDKMDKHFDERKYRDNVSLVFNLCQEFNSNDSVELLIVALALFRYGKHHGTSSAFASYYLACKAYSKTECKTNQALQDILEKISPEIEIKAHKLRCIMCKKLKDHKLLERVQDLVDKCTTERKTRNVIDKLLSTKGGKYLSVKDKTSGPVYKGKISEFNKG